MSPLDTMLQPVLYCYCGWTRGAINLAPTIVTGKDWMSLTGSILNGGRRCCLFLWCSLIGRTYFLKRKDAFCWRCTYQIFWVRKHCTRLIYSRHFWRMKPLLQLGMHLLLARNLSHQLLTTCKQTHQFVTLCLLHRLRRLLTGSFSFTQKERNMGQC